MSALRKPVAYSVQRTAYSAGLTSFLRQLLAHSRVKGSVGDHALGIKKQKIADRLSFHAVRSTQYAFCGAWRMVRGANTYASRFPLPASRAQGFSLVELVIVIMVTAVAVGVLVQVVGELTGQGQGAQLITASANLARERLEEVLADRQTYTRPFNQFIGSDYPDEIPVAGFGVYERRVSIDYVELPNLEAPVTGPTNYKRVLVTVHHPEIGDYSTSTVFSRRAGE